MKSGTPVLRSTQLLDQVQERFRYLHCSLSTGGGLPVSDALFHPLARSVWGMRHPREMGAQEVEAFLTRWHPGT